MNIPPKFVPYNIPQFKPLYKPEPIPVHIYLNEKKSNYFENLIDNQSKFKNFLNKPLFREYRLKRSIDYEMNCIYCKSSNVITSQIFELQKCHNCNKEYVPKVLELK